MGTVADSDPSQAKRAAARGRLLPANQEFAVFATVAVCFVAMAVTMPSFLTLGNMFALTRGISVLGILALGMGIVVIARGIDLSQVAVLASTCGITVVLLNSGIPAPVALGGGLLIATGIGCLNGLLIAFVEIPALFATLATGLLTLGATRALVLPQLIVYLGPENAWLQQFGGNLSIGLPIPVIVFAVVALIMHVFLVHTVLGRSIYAQGDNPDTAWLTGMPVRPMIVTEYALSSAIGYIGGLVMVASTSLMHLQIADSSLIFDVILVVVLGGISLTGGRGGVSSVIAGTLLIGILLNGMTLLNLDTQTQNIIRGAVLLAAIVADSLLHPHDEETSKQGL